MNLEHSEQTSETRKEIEELTLEAKGMQAETKRTSGKVVAAQL